eukprot:SAG11_NODE_15599_length_572_cov_1.285412_1_plen_182_part_10
MRRGTRSATPHVVHAISNSVLGPYEKLSQPHDIVLPTFAHNPSIRLHPDGTYLLYFIGQPEKRMDSPTNWTLESTISLAYSRSVDGPWQIIRGVLPGRGKGSPYFDADATNPSPIILRDGSILLLYRGNFRPHGGRGLLCWNRLGAAKAAHWRGPYTRLGDKPILPLDHCNEDPVGWQDRRG